MKGENSKMRKATGVAMAVVTAVTVFMVRNFMNQARESPQTWAPGNSQVNYTQVNPQEGDSAGEAGADGVVVRTEAEYAAAQDFARRYSGEWNVEKYFDGNQWKIYELGKRMAIVAYNFLNDYSYTTGGYKYIVGSEGGKSPEGSTCTECGIGIMRRETGVFAVDLSATKYQCDFCGHEERVSTEPVYQYEYVPEERHEVHGKDIEYSTPAITISDDRVDMSEMGGPVFDLVMFRVETIKGQEYLINDDFGFAIAFDGTYLEYYEPDAYGHYQGYYAFR